MNDKQIVNMHTFLQIDISLAMYAVHRTPEFGLLNTAIV